MSSDVVVLDTHAWLWLNDDPARLSRPGGEAIEAAGAIGVPAMCCWELALLVAKGRIELQGGVSHWVRAALGQAGILALPVNAKIAVEAGLLDDAFPGDPADRLIYATARDAGATLITRDRRMREFDPRGTVW